jgi:hypothetical protein
LGVGIGSTYNNIYDMNACAETHDCNSTRIYEIGVYFVVIGNTQESLIKTTIELLLLK